jgi:hypothetical protein
MDDDDRTLAQLINDYRASEGLPPVPLSAELGLVARTHARDLHEKRPDAPASCNMHSWSNAGTWSGCCYTRDHARASCMWDKPRELTDYRDNGYEIAAGGRGSISPSLALSLWQRSSAHDAVILNEGTWARRPWRAMGVVVEHGYALVWFGEDR